jgi:glycosyltransferase involved in cell wall biosynthesis
VSELTFTVFTPTRNRAHTLPRVYNSLREQTFQYFEWLIVDDGSTDDTRELVERWAAESDFPIRYFWQEHGGKARATNRGVTEARGTFFLALDSDDIALPNALERFRFHWQSIPEDERNRYSAVTCLLQDESGRLCGDRFPLPLIDSDSIEIRDRYAIKGEKWGFHRTEVLKKFPFPEIEGETFITEGIVWTRIAQSYKTRYVNEVLGTYVYERDSVRNTGVRVRNPIGAALHYRQLANASHPMSIRFRMKSYVNYIRYALHAGVGFLTQIAEVNSPVRWFLAMPVALVLFGRDRFRLW